MAVYKEAISQIKYENFSQKHDFEWNTIRLLIRLVRIDTALRAFQY